MASTYEDYLSKWYVSDGGKHQAFLNQIKDENLKSQVDTIIETKRFDKTFDTRFNFDVSDQDQETAEILETSHNEKFSVWFGTNDDGTENPNKHKLYRLTPGENAEKGTSQKNVTSTGSSSSSGNNNFKPNTGERGWFDSKSHRCVTEEEYIKRSAEDFMIRPLTAKEKTPNNFMVMEKGKRIVYLWIGKWMKPNN